jgi:hypothetical protein
MLLPYSVAFFFLYRCTPYSVAFNSSLNGLTAQASF